MLEFCDGFDHYDNGQLGFKWTSADTSSGFGVTAGVGRFGTKGYNGTGARQVYKLLPGGALAERIIGFAFNARDGFGSRQLLTIMDGASGQIELRLVSGKINAYRDGAVLIAGALGTTQIVGGVWYFLEVRFLHHNSTGEIEVRINGVTQFALTGVDTQSTANATSDGIRLFDSAGGGGQAWIDDLYVLDTVDSGIAGAPNDDFIGDIKVESLMPDGNGNSSDLVGSDADSTDNYLLVDEIPPDDDTTYVESSTVGDKDTYEYEDLSSSNGSVFGIQIMPWARKTDAGVREIVTVARESGGTEEDGPNHALGASYSYFFDPRDGDPDGNQWTVSSINAAEFGVKVAA